VISEAKKRPRISQDGIREPRLAETSDSHPLHPTFFAINLLNHDILFKLIDSSVPRRRRPSTAYYLLTSYKKPLHLELQTSRQATTTSITSHKPQKQWLTTNQTPHHPTAQTASPLLNPSTKTTQTTNTLHKANTTINHNRTSTSNKVAILLSKVAIHHSSNSTMEVLPSRAMEASRRWDMDSRREDS